MWLSRIEHLQIQHKRLSRLNQSLSMTMSPKPIPNNPLQGIYNDLYNDNIFLMMLLFLENVINKVTINNMPADVLIFFE